MDDVLDQTDLTADIDQIDDNQGDTSSSDSDVSAENKKTSSDTNGDTNTDKVDGRKFNPEWSKALKELRELYPDKADMLTKMRDNYARFQDVQALAPKGLDDIRAWKTTIDAVGGPEAAAEMMQRVAGMEAMDAKIEAGDDSFVDELPENLQKGVFGMVPQLLNRLSESDQAAFSAAVAPHFASALAGTGLGTVIDTQMAGLKQLYDRTTDPEMKAQIRDLYNDASKTKTWFDGQTQGKSALPGAGSKTINPEVASLQKKLQGYEATDEKTFLKTVTDATNSHIGKAFAENTAVYVKQFNLTESQQSDLMDSFGTKLTNKLGEDAAFQKQLKAYKALKTPADQVNTYIQSKVDENAKTIIDGLVTARYGGMKTRKAPAVDASTTTTTNGAVRVAQTPSQDTWDMDKMLALGHNETAAKGIFHLKNGKTVQFVRPN